MQQYKIFSQGRAFKQNSYVYFAIVYDTVSKRYFKKEFKNCSTQEEFLKALTKSLQIKKRD